jgi:50S ribosomal protein L16 3-hydroxylase
MSTPDAPPLAGLSPAAFMRRWWQRQPLVLRSAMPGIVPPVSRARLFALAASADVESRLVVREHGRWSVRHGPLARRTLPPIARRGWTLLVQGLEAHDDAAARLLARFRFLPDARLDDLMISWASDGGGVGPHVDSYDVFLVQVHGRRRWRVGAVREAVLREGLPLKVLDRFEPDRQWVLEPGDILYLPPGWGHEGVAIGECMTCSVGFRAATADELASQLLMGLADGDAEAEALRYRDACARPTAAPGEIPPALQRFARRAVARRLAQPHAVERALGEWLSEPKPRVWFRPGGASAADSPAAGAGVRLDRATRMLYDDRFVYINGASYRASGRDARLMRRLSDQRFLAAADIALLGAQASTLLQEWIDTGWAHGGKR